MSHLSLLDLPAEISDHIIAKVTDYHRTHTIRLSHTCTRLYALCERHRYRTLELFGGPTHISYLYAFLRRPHLLNHVRHVVIPWSCTTWGVASKG
jgi:hypothetical protein